MGKRVLTPAGDGKPIGMYSAGFVAEPAQLVFVAGQVAMDAEGRVVGAGDLAAQATQVYQNLAAILAEAGCTLRDVVKFTTFLVRSEDWAPFAAWRKAEYPTALPRRRLSGEHGRGGEGAGAARAPPRGRGHRRASRPRAAGPEAHGARGAPAGREGEAVPARASVTVRGERARGRHGEVRLRAGARRGRP